MLMLINYLKRVIFKVDPVTSYYTKARRQLFSLGNEKVLEKMSGDISSSKTANHKKQELIVFGWSL